MVVLGGQQWCPSVCPLGVCLDQASVPRSVLPQAPAHAPRDIHPSLSGLPASPVSAAVALLKGRPVCPKK